MTDDPSQSPISETRNRSLDQRPECYQRPSKVPRVDDDDEHRIHDSSDESDGDGGGAEIGDRTMSRNPGTQRYLVAIEYIGTRFFGAQRQSNYRTVVGVLEEAFHQFVGQLVPVICSSRTDTGVHALSNVCHVDVERISKRKPGEVLPPHEPAVVKRAVNHFLQKNEGDIKIIDVRCVAADFHARYKARERTYFYRLLSGTEPLSTFEKDRAWYVAEELDLIAMQKACKVLIGRHDFSSFRAVACQAKSPIRTLDELSVTEVASAPYFPSAIQRQQSYVERDHGACSNGSEIDLLDTSLASCKNKVENSNGQASEGFGLRRGHRCFVVTARSRSFLYHQVRLLVGVLKAVGTGDLTVHDVERILKAKSVSAAKAMAPACGLYLGHVKYDLP